tara:strand:- start:338 stop:1096 length:759 start_codon:yes stop_codon:yes gene_type:complete
VSKEYRPRLNDKENEFLQEHRRKKVNRLIVGDIHLPYTHPRYLQHCIDIYKKHDCNAVSMTGDIIDSHFASFHSINTETHGAKYELDMAIKETAKWYEAFNNDTVPNGITITLGNHDLIIARKSEEAGIDNRWVRKLNEVLKCPDWIFEEQFLHDNVLYAHGTGCSGKGIMRRVQNWGHSMVQGHIHTQAFVDFTASLTDLKWGMQSPCGIDYKSFAFSYSKFHTAKPILGCAVVLDNGKMPIIEPMILNQS